MHDVNDRRGRATIITPTYNKPDDLRAAARCVFAQSDERWNWWIILDGPTRQTRLAAHEIASRDDRVRIFEEPTTEEERRRAYRPAAILNAYLPRIPAGRICWLADDDLWDRRFLERMCGALDRHPDWDIVFCGFGTYHVLSDGRLVHRYDFTDYRDRGLSTPFRCWGEVLSINTVFTLRAWNAIQPYRIPEEWNTARMCDHLLMRQLEARFTVHAVPEQLVTNRVTARSANTIVAELNAAEAESAGISLKSLDESDLEFARHLRNANRHAFRDDREISTAEQQRWFVRLQTDARIAFYIVLDGEQRVGTLSLTDRGDAIEVGNLALVPEWRGRGIMEYACRLLMKPYHRYTAEVREENHASRRLLERLGIHHTLLKQISPPKPNDTESSPVAVAEHQGLLHGGPR